MDDPSPLVGADVAGTPAWAWLIFAAVLVTLLAFDLRVAHRGGQANGLRRSLLLSAAYIGVAVLFGAWVWWSMGAPSGLDYFTGYLIEKSLSIDNVFVIALIFTALSIPPHLQHRVLFWAIVGVIGLRAIMIGLGAALVSEFSAVLYAFGIFLVLTGIRTWVAADRLPVFVHHPVLRLLERRVPLTDGLRGEAFWVREPEASTGRPVRRATPLFLALVLIAFVDLVFAVESVPAIFAISTDPFIVYTSNIFALLGLHALYFALAAMIHRFKYLKYALGLVLVFVGSKVFLVGLVGKIPAAISLAVIASLIAGGVWMSWWKTRADPAGSQWRSSPSGPDLPGSARPFE
jgi:tellurite resistance protein TerC